MKKCKLKTNKLRTYIISVSILSILSTILAVNIGSGASSNVAPVVDNVGIDSITEKSAIITFTVDQNDASTVIHYGTTKSLKKLSDWNNDTSLKRSIILTGLSPGSSYSFSIFAYNSSNPSKFSDTAIQKFKTKTALLRPNISNINIDTTSSTADITFDVDQDNANTVINYGKTDSLGTLSDWNNNTGSHREIIIPNLLSDTEYKFSIYVYNGDNQDYFSNSAISSFITSSPKNPPKITNTSPERIKRTSGQEPIEFIISFDQIANVAWYLNGTIVSIEDSVTSSSYFNDTPKLGDWNVTAIIENDNGKTSYSWEWIVEPERFGTGNRIWDGSKGMNTNYIWNSYSFAGFYYDIDNNLSTEELTIKNIKRTINKDDIIYTTSPVEVDFAYPDFGKYQVIGFMANKYFAGYTTNSTISNRINSVIERGQLQKVLLDEEDKHSISVGSTLTLEEGYVLRMNEVDIGAGKGQIWISLLKDGVEVDNGVVEAGDNYIYSKKVGYVQDLPIIAIHFDTVFRGKETNAAFIRGLFQVSEIPQNINTGDSFGEMEISVINRDKIVMTNSQNIDLSQGDTIDLMGDLKIIVANSDILRFALSVERTGTFDARGTIYPMTTQWTPMNFGLNVGNSNIGFYYDLNEDIGTENLKIEGISGESIPKGNLIYSTSPQEVNFAYPDFGKYQVIGFMANKYFAGYTENTMVPNPTSSITKNSVISQGELHKIVLDDENKRTITVGGTLSLGEGYVLKATDIDMSARTMLLTLLKDGDEVDSGTPLSAGETYVYTKRVGGIELPLIIVRFDNVFSGLETQAAFLKGIFQISESPTSVNVGDRYGEMEVNSVNDKGITMENYDSIGLSSGNNIDLMGDIKFKVADSSDLRFYPFVTVTQDMIGNQLLINAPKEAIAGNNITINVTAGGDPIEGVSIILGTDVGTTDSSGNINYTLPNTLKGMYNITATKTGYQSGTKSINIKEYIEKRLSLDMPIKANQSEKITIKVTYNNTPIGGSTIKFDNVTIGTSDNNGTLIYKLDSNGNHTISAAKEDYITVSREIDIRELFAEFIALNIDINPNKIFANGKTTISSNITNIGTKADTKLIDLLVNGTLVDNRSILLNPKEQQQINFIYKTNLPEGNYTVQILDQEKLLEVKNAPMNLLLIGSIFTIITAIAIYIFTTKNDFGESIKKYINR